MKNKLIKIITIILSLLLLIGCNKEELTKEKQIANIIEENNYIIVDVRTKEEYDEEHIKDAINIPYDVIKDSNLDKNKTIMVYCKSGKRSSTAYYTLKNLGYDVFDLGAYSTINLEKE